MTSQTVNNVIKLINIPEKNKVALKGTEGTYDLNQFGYFHPNIIKKHISGLSGTRIPSTVCVW